MKGYSKRNKYSVEVSQLDDDGKIKEVTLFVPKIRLVVFSNRDKMKGLFRIGPYLGRKILSLGSIALIKDVNSEGDIFVGKRIFVV